MPRNDPLRSKRGTRHVTSISQGELTGQVALVTGGVRRIGRSIALTLAREGAAIAVNAKSSRDEAAETVREIEGLGGAARVIMGDVTDEAEVARMVAEIGGALGAVDILVNNAAVRRDDIFTAMSFADWRLVMAVVLDGAFLCSRAVIPGMVAKGRGTIINIGGVTGHTGASGRAHVSTAKAGLVGLTKALAVEFGGNGITVMANGKATNLHSLWDGLEGNYHTATLIEFMGERLMTKLPSKDIESQMAILDFDLDEF